jgi:hypothetical protein
VADKSWEVRDGADEELEPMAFSTLHIVESPTRLRSVTGRGRLSHRLIGAINRLLFGGWRKLYVGLLVLVLLLALLALAATFYHDGWADRPTEPGSAWSPPGSMGTAIGQAVG